MIPRSVHGTPGTCLFFVFVARAGVFEEVVVQGGVLAMRVQTLTARVISLSLLGLRRASTTTWRSCLGW